MILFKIIAWLILILIAIDRIVLAGVLLIEWSERRQGRDWF